MKKLLALLLAVLLLAGCTAAPTPTDAPSTQATTLQTEPAKPVKNLIIIIGDGMGPSQIEAAQQYYGKTFSFTQWDSIKVNTNSLNAEGQPEQLTDSAASATALATGTLTTNGTVGRDPSGKDLVTVLDIAKELGMATGIVTTDLLTGATPAGFSAHAPNRDDDQMILNSQVHSGVDLLCSATTGGINPKDFEKTGYAFYDNIKEVSPADEKALWQLYLPETDAGDKLAKATTAALEFLSKDTDGFVLMIEEAKVDKNCHKNDMTGCLKAVNSLNNTVDAVLAWLGDRDDTAILVTADHETGGLLLGAEGEYLHGCPRPDGSKFSYEFTTEGHSKTPVWLFTYGFRPELASRAAEDGTIKNTVIFQIMEEYLRTPAQ